MLYYAQKALHSKDEPWSVVEDSPQDLKQLTEQNFMFRSVLAISEAVTDSTDFTKVSYQGGLYFDIDSETLAESISRLKRLITALKGVDVSDFQIYGSGSKGFHLLVPAKHFSEGKAVRYLPYIYADIRNRLGADYTDAAVYSGGKGRMFRRCNVLRRLDGKLTYKTEIPTECVKTLTPLQVRLLASTPRPITRPDVKGGTIEPLTDVKAVKLGSMFLESQALISAERKAIEKIEFKPIPELKQLSEVPGCIQKLCRYEVNDEANFNLKALNLMAFLQSSSLSEQQSKQCIHELAKHGKSGTYRTSTQRKEHILSLKNQGKFSLSFLFKQIEPCGGCLLCDGSLDDGVKKNVRLDECVEEADEYGDKLAKIQGHLVAGSEVGVEDLHYFITYGSARKTFDKPISTFVLILEHVGVEYDPITHRPTRRGALFTIHYLRENKHTYSELFLNEEDWNSLSAFKQATSGIGSATFLGSEQELTQLKHYIFSQETDDIMIRYIEKYGITKVVETNARGNVVAEYLTYVEPGVSLSVKQENVEGVVRPVTYYNQLSYDGPKRRPDDMTPSLMSADSLQHSDHELVSDVLKAYFGAGYGPTMAASLGWFVSCLFKPHFLEFMHDWPVLGIVGIPQSGKTSLLKNLGYLHGIECNHVGRNKIMDAQSSTTASIRDAISVSCSTAVLLDEVTIARMKRQEANDKSSLIKNSYDMSTIQVRAGSSNKSPKRFISMTGCVAFTAETEPTNDELSAFVTRVLWLRYTLQHRKLEGVQASYEAFNELKGCDVFKQVGKTLVRRALGAPIGFTKEFFENAKQSLPNELRDSATHRLSTAYTVALAGLDLLTEGLSCVDINVSALVKKYRKELASHIQREAAELRKKSLRGRFLVKIMNDLAVMLESQTKNSLQYAQIGLMPGFHFCFTEEAGQEYFYINVNALFANYMQAKSRGLGGSKSVCSSADELLTIMQEESDVYQTTTYHPDVGQGRVKLAKLSVSAMYDLYIDIDVYKNYVDMYNHYESQRKNPTGGILTGVVREAANTSFRG